MITINLDIGLRQPLQELIAQGHQPPFMVICNAMAYAPGSYESEYGEIVVQSTYTHQPIDDLTVTTVEAWEAFKSQEGE